MPPQSCYNFDRTTVVGRGFNSHRLHLQRPRASTGGAFTRSGEIAVHEKLLQRLLSAVKVKLGLVFAVVLFKLGLDLPVLVAVIVHGKTMVNCRVPWLTVHPSACNSATTDVTFTA